MSSDPEKRDAVDEALRIIRQAARGRVPTVPNPRRPQGIFDRYFPVAFGLLTYPTAGFLGLAADIAFLHGWQLQHLPFQQLEPLPIVLVDGALPALGMYKLGKALRRL